MWRSKAMLWDFSGNMLTPDDEQAAFDSPQGIQALTMLGDMATVDHSIYIDTTNARIQQTFNNGHIGMMVTGPWDLPSFPDVQFGVQVMPANHQTISAPEDSVILDDGAAQVAASSAFVKSFTAPPQRMSFDLHAQGAPDPPVPGAAARLPAYLAKYPGTELFVEDIGDAVKARPTIPRYTQISTSSDRRSCR